MEKPMNPTPYPELNELLQALLQNVQVILGPHFAGMYLEGSLANGAFDRASDIDFIVVTDEDITKDLFLALRAMHDHIARLDARWGFELEGSYVGRQAMRGPSRRVSPLLPLIIMPAILRPTSFVLYIISTRISSGDRVSVLRWLPMTNPGSFISLS
jgi:hypothetical protein